MKLQEFRKLIREEARKVLKEVNKYPVLKFKNTVIKNKYKKTSGFMTLKYNMGLLTISYNGNMGGFEDLNEKLSWNGMPEIDDLKKIYTVVEEKGSPNYSYYLALQVNPGDKYTIK